MKKLFVIRRYFTATRDSILTAGLLLNENLKLFSRLPKQLDERLIAVKFELIQTFKRKIMDKISLYL